jgi:hypothetical protein
MKIITALLLACAILGDTTRAAVVEVTAVGFGVTNEVQTTAPPKRIYDALLHNVAQWWNPKHTYAGDSHQLSITPKVGGCFCERLPHGGSVEHARVITLIPYSLVRMSGALGPLQSSGLVGTLSWKISDAPGGAKIEISYNVGGYMHGAFANIAPAVDEVMADQLNRLKTFSETGKTP